MDSAQVDTAQMDSAQVETAQEATAQPDAQTPADGHESGNGPLSGSAQQAAAEGSDSAETGKGGLPVQGMLNVRYRHRSADGGASDDDLTSSVQMRVGDPMQDAVSVQLMAWANADLGGDKAANDPFFDINDTYSGDVTARLYEAYLDLHRVKGLGVLRLGRQPFHDAPVYVSFDGLRLETSPLGGKAVSLGAYGGVPVHHFESSSSGDAVIGAYVDLRPWDGGRARLDYMHLEDADLLGDHRNDLVGARLWQNVGKKLLLEGAFSVLEGESRDVRARATWSAVEQELVLRAAYYHLFKTQGDLATELDPFYEILREYHPYHDLQFLAAKGFAQRYRAELGTQIRLLDEDEDEGEFNREFERYYGRFVVEDFLVEDLALGLNGELHDAGAGKYSSWSADLERRWDERWRTVLGTFYALYDVDLFGLRERNDVRVYYFDVAFRVTKATRLLARYEFEDDDLDDYHVVKIGMTWRF